MTSDYDSKCEPAGQCTGNRHRSDACCPQIDRASYYEDGLENLLSQ